MTKPVLLVATLIGVSVSASAAFAACTVPSTYKLADGTTTNNAAAVDDGSGNCIFKSLSTNPAGASIYGVAGTANASVTTVQGVASMTPLTVTQSGNWTQRLTGNAGATLDATIGGGTAPTNMLAVGGQFRSSPQTLTNLQTSALQLDSVGALVISASNVSLAQGSATAGQSGSLIMGAVTTSAPSYTATQTSPLSLTPAGDVRVNCSNCSGSGISQTDQGTFTAGTSLFASGGGVFQTTATANPLADGKFGTFQVTANRALFTNLRNAAGTEVGTTTTPLQVSVANTGANATALLVTGTGGTFPVTPIATTANGTSNYHAIAAASDNHVVIKNGASNVYTADCTTSSTAAAYVRLYDAGTGFNGCNSATNLAWGAVCPASASASGVGAGFMKDFGPTGRSFTNGVSICITGGFTDTDVTNAPTTAIVNVGYK